MSLTALIISLYAYKIIMLYSLNIYNFCLKILKEGYISLTVITLFLVLSFPVSLPSDHSAPFWTMHASFDIKHFVKKKKKYLSSYQPWQLPLWNPVPLLHTILTQIYYNLSLTSLLIHISNPLFLSLLAWDLDTYSPRLPVENLSEFFNLIYVAFLLHANTFMINSIY